MPSRDVTLDVGGASYPGRLNTPDGDAEQGILVIPGAGHGPFGDVFDRFSQAAATDGYTVARFETWQDTDDLDEKTPADFAAEIDAGIEFLRDEGCSSMHVVAKSFGGRLALEHVPDLDDDAVANMVLWAPAIVFDEHPEAPTISAAELEAIRTPTRILQGDEDQIPVENAAALVEHVQNGELVELPGEDHSFLNDQQRVIEETLAFLPR